MLKGLNMLLLINSIAIHPIDNKEYDENPLKVFETFYKSNELPYIMSFESWLNKYIVPTDYQSVETNAVEKRIEKVLNDKEQLKLAVVKLFPYQFKMDEYNWPEIAETLNMVRANRGKAVEELEYDNMYDFFNENIGKIINV